MKRHEAIAPLSREHHTALILAQMMKHNAPDYRGMPKQPADKAGYAMNIFQTSLQQHFVKEEKLLGMVKHLNADIGKLSDEIISEHEQLTAGFLSLSCSTHLEDSLNELGVHLEDHIRKEERVLFPLIEQWCPEDLIAEIKALNF